MEFDAPNPYDGEGTPEESLRSFLDLAQGAGEEAQQPAPADKENEISADEVQAGADQGATATDQGAAATDQGAAATDEAAAATDEAAAATDEAAAATDGSCY